MGLQSETFSRNMSEHNSITTLRVNTLQSAGDFASDLALSGNGQAVGAPVLGNTRVGGALAAGDWNVAGKTVRVAAGSVGNGWSGTFGNLASLAVAGDLAGDVTADSINSVAANTMTGARITLNQAFSAPRRPVAL